MVGVPETVVPVPVTASAREETRPRQASGVVEVTGLALTTKMETPAQPDPGVGEVVGVADIILV